MIYSVSGLAEAVELAEELRASRMCDWFRGQTRNWPLQSSFVRRDNAGQEVARERLARFHGWLQGVPELDAIAANTDAVLAVAQHYGIPTNLVDFTTEPSVAAFFAGARSPATQGGGRRRLHYLPEHPRARRGLGSDSHRATGVAGVRPDTTRHPRTLEDPIAARRFPPLPIR